MKNVKILSTGILLASLAALAGCGQLADVVSGKAGAEQSILDQSEDDFGVAVTSVSCEDAPADASWDFTCDGDSELGPVRFQVTEINQSSIQYVPVNLFTSLEMASLNAELASSGVTNPDCGGGDPLYVPLDSLTLTCTGTDLEGGPVELNVIIDESDLSYTVELAS